MSFMLGDSIALLEKSLDLRMVRQNLLASNIANAETPGYRALDIDFEAALRQMAAQQEDPEGASSDIRVRLIAADSASPTPDGNTVAIETELSKASTNQLMFNMQAQILGMKLRQLRDATQTP